MANTSVVYARIDTDLKSSAEEILSQLGISPSGVIQMLYSQIVLTRSVPFALRLPSTKPAAFGSMTGDALDTELKKGIESIKSGRVYSVDEVDAELGRAFGI